MFFLNISINVRILHVLKNNYKISKGYEQKSLHCINKTKNFWYETKVKDG